MAELTISQDEVIGIKKEIEEGSLELIFNALQSDIYSQPMRSFIRETISNALDSIIEKNVFRKINDGEPVEKYFLQRQDGALLKDSAYDPLYYSIQNLSEDDKVSVVYEESQPRDKITITDHGVGLGGKRLKGFFKLGYSSKRNFLTARGLYGLGSKSALSTGVDYFTMTTVYNGYKTSFMIYNRDYDPITPESPDGIMETWKVTMANDEVVDKNIYWGKTSEENSCEISVEVKKHNKKTYIKAVKEQFQYFNGAVKLHVKNIESSDDFDNLNERPEYESEHLLIPKYSTYSSPHILVDGISYGLVNWSELELEVRRGKIALKVSANDVDITQNRETLKWTDKTKSTILNAIRIAEDEAGEYVRQNIAIDDEENVFALNDAYNNSSSRGGSYTVTSTFSTFLAMHNIRPKYKFTLEGYKKPVTAVLGENLFEFLFYSFDFKTVYTTVESGKLKLKTETIKSFHELSSRKLVYAKEGNLGVKLASHLLEEFNATSFVYARKNHTRIKDTLSLSKMGEEYPTKTVEKCALALIEKYNDLFVDTYEWTYIEPEPEIEDDNEVIVKDNKVNQAKLRKANKEVLWYEYEYNTDVDDYNSFIRHKVVRKVDQLDKLFQHTNLIVVPSKYTKLGKMMVLTDHLFKGPQSFDAVFVSEDNAQVFMKMGATHIQNYFRNVDPNTGEIMIGDKLVDLNTAWQFKKLKDKYLDFANCSEIICKLSAIDKEKYDTFRYHNARSIKDVMMNATSQDTSLLTEILSYLDSLAEFQTVVGSKDKDAIAVKALEVFDTDKIHNIYAYDKDYIDSVEEELDRLNPIAPIINSISSYSEGCTPLLELLLNTIHKNKNKDD
jgi:hypothetical protein